MSFSSAHPRGIFTQTPCLRFLHKCSFVCLSCVYHSQKTNPHTAFKPFSSIKVVLVECWLFSISNCPDGQNRPSTNIYIHAHAHTCPQAQTHNTHTLSAESNKDSNDRRTNGVRSPWNCGKLFGSVSVGLVCCDSNSYDNGVWRNPVRPAPVFTHCPLK